MSRIGRMPIPLTDKVKLEVKGAAVEVSGPLGKLTQKLPPGISVKVEKNAATIETSEMDSVLGGPLHGLARSLVNNAITGVTVGFKKDLEIVGLGYRAGHQPFPDPDKKRGVPQKRGWLKISGGGKIFFQLGLANDIEFRLPPEIKTTIDAKQTAVSISGIDGALVGEVTAQIRRLKKPEPYKGTGIRYVGEHIIRKAGKAAAGAVSGSASGGAKK